MNESNNYSDEHISAYIDGEHDDDERARILYDEQNDAELGQRINEARMLKEKVQLAYSGVAKADDANHLFSCAALVNRHRVLVASFLVICTFTAVFGYNISVNNNLAAAKQLIASTRPIAAHQIKDVIASNARVVIHLSQYEQNNFADSIENIEALLEQHETDTAFSIELVASGRGLKALDVSSSIYAKRLSLLADRFNSLKVIACAKSLSKLATDDAPVQLLKSIIITPSAAQQVAKRSKQGWSYIKI